MYNMSLVHLRIKPRQTCQHLQIGNHTKILSEVSIEHSQRVRHANRGRLLLQTPGPVPLWDLHMF